MPVAVAFPAAQTNPGAIRAKEFSTNQQASAPQRWCAFGALRGILYVKTTLGNGYLGSRIDEERSEMRYLV